MGLFGGSSKSSTSSSVSTVTDTDTQQVDASGSSGVILSGTEVTNINNLPDSVSDILGGVWQFAGKSLDALTDIVQSAGEATDKALTQTGQALSVAIDSREAQSNPELNLYKSYIPIAGILGIAVLLAFWSKK